jgi:hypothetical protein
VRPPPIRPNSIKVERLEFSWEGQDENDDALGCGWAYIKNDHLEGRFYFKGGNGVKGPLVPRGP